MKRILFVINHMDIGGIQTSLIRLLTAITREYEIDLLCIRPDGELIPQLPKEIKLLVPLKIVMISEMSVKQAFGIGAGYGLLRSILSAWTKAFGKALPARVITGMSGIKLSGYDAAISFTQPSAGRALHNLCNEMVLNACRAKRKITFIHCDFESYGGNNRYNRSLYEQFDLIAAVSDSVGAIMKEAVPKAAHKVVTVRNYLNERDIQLAAEEQRIEYREKIPVITAARLSPEKGIARCIPIFVRLKSQGYDVKWHIIGEGPEENVIRSCINQYSANGAVELQGKLINPYPYMKGAALLLVPSLHEAAPVVFDEAGALGLPVLTTDTASARELVERRGLGWVCGMADEDIYCALKEFADGKRRGLRRADVDEEEPLRQFRALINRPDVGR